MKKLNDELAELLGIEAMCVSYAEDGCTYTYKPNKVFTNAVYPDFTEPNNFLKLLNLVYKCGINQKYDFQLASLSFEYDDNSIWIDEVEEIKISFENVWIECLKTRLQTNNPDSWDINFANTIKHQAQQTDWSY